MLNNFINWASIIMIDNTENFLEMSITVNKPSDNRSVRLDIDTLSCIARITFWEAGDYDAEIVKIKDEKTIYSCQGNVSLENSLSEQFYLFFELLNLSISSVHDKLPVISQT